MIAKIVKGTGAKGIVDYILDREKGGSLIDHDGVLVSDNGSIARSLIAQSRLNPKVGKFIGHVSLSFSGQDLPRLTDELMIQISREYMMKMGIRDTQYIIGRHYDKGHPHVHIAFNRVDDNGRTISDRNDRYRSERVCKELTRKYGLYFAEGKEQVNTNRLKEPDRTKYELFFLLKTEVGRCGDWDTLIASLQKQGVEVRFKHKGRTDGIQGVVFGKNGYSFNGSKIDRQFSYSKIAAALNLNNPQERQAQSFRQGISPASGGGGELINGSLGLLDLPPSSCTETPEEAEFRRLMQRKKKKNKGFRI
ncbi:relaxase/mobilization nuclease domain-containing protein [Bacteroides uniformis]|uniref:relaxase/mobilization nuclease domain-containing protein n=1 Tax=Bacteroides uniformis TaxID=820 RepID=UPI0023A92516|nr:relaxase/mobilization nuclease domain-containing protein [Bacteroides uniformis]MDE5170706.1 relaxase/mobilization nuclease domain-containing protein [Bacteroides uniformis]